MNNSYLFIFQFETNCGFKMLIVHHKYLYTALCFVQ